MSILFNRIEFTTMVDACCPLKNGNINGQNMLLDVKAHIIAKRTAIIADLRQSLHKVTRQQYNNLQTLFKEQVDVITDLLAADKPDEVWQDEMRFYSQGNGSMQCRCGDHEITLGEEFSSASMLVCTPLTRRARTAQIRALATRQVFCATGPAGTGKTETIKDTYRMLGIEGVVVNCTDTMTRSEVLKASQLAVGRGPNCPLIFDEFNRLPVEVMDMVVEQTKKHPVCITFNPGYKQRKQVPQELVAKFLMQPMTVPNYEVIVQVMLGSEGITDADGLGVKLWACLQTCTHTFSKQYHYDFGLRFIKGVLRDVGRAGRDRGYDNEALLVASTLFNFLYMRSVPEDRVLCELEVGRAFKGLAKAEEITSATKSLVEAAGGDQAEAVANLVASATQLRHGVMVLGCQNIDRCVAAIQRVTGAVNFVVDANINNSGNDGGKTLFGEDGALVRCWNDAAAVGVSEGEGAVGAHLIFKGGLSNADMTHLHTTLDDNKCICFPSGMHLKLPKHVKLIFFGQPSDVKHWSPATVSRLGAVYSPSEGELYPNRSLKPHHQFPQRANAKANTKASMKVTLGGETRRVQLTDDKMDFAALLELIRTLFHEVCGSTKAQGHVPLRITYKDDENDTITISSDGELLEALDVAESQGSLLRLFAETQAAEN